MEDQNENGHIWFWVLTKDVRKKIEMEKKRGEEIYLGGLVEENINIKRTLKWWVIARFLEASNTF